MADDSVSSDDYGFDFSEEGGESVSFNAEAKLGPKSDYIQQKTVGGQVESPISRLAKIEAALAKEKADREEDIKTFEIELESLRRSLSAAEAKAAAANSDLPYSFEDIMNLKLENTKLKAENADLQQKIAELSAVPEVTVPQVSDVLREEFINYCARMKLYPEMEVQALTEEDCVKILNTAPPSAPTSKPKKSKKAKGLAAAAASGAAASSTWKFGNTAKERAIEERLSGLEGELRSAIDSTEDIRALKANLLQMAERTRIEKEHRQQSDIEVKMEKRKVDMLADHMEKLMVHLRTEATSKIRLTEKLRNAERENVRVREKADAIEKRSALKDKLVAGLKEGTKVLEDQLALMDEKYLELRTKLDYAREAAQTKIKKAQKTSRELRMKFAMAGNNTGLDSMPLPQIGDGTFIPGTMGNMLPYPGALPPSAGAGMGGGQHQQQQFDQQQQQQQQLRFSATLPTRRAKSAGGVRRDVSRSLQQEPNLDNVLDKVRKHQGKPRVWTEEKLRALTDGR